MATNYYSHYTYTDVSTDRFARAEIKKDFHKLEAFEPDTHICDMFEYYSPSPVTHNTLIIDGLSQDILERDVLIRPTIDGALVKISLTNMCPALQYSKELNKYISKKVNICKPTYLNRMYNARWADLSDEYLGYSSLQDDHNAITNWCDNSEILFDIITAIQPLNMNLNNFNEMIQTLVSVLSPKGAIVLETVTDYAQNAFNKAMGQTLMDIVQDAYIMYSQQQKWPELFSCGISHKAIVNALNERRMKYYAIDTISTHVDRQEWLDMVDNAANEYNQRLVTYNNILEDLRWAKWDDSVVDELHETFDKTKYELTHMTDPAIKMISAKEHNFVYASMDGRML